MGAGISIAAVGTALAMAYPLIDSLAREYNQKKAAKVRATLNAILSKYNVTMSQLRNAMEVKNVKYANILDRLNTASPVGRAFKIKTDLEKKQQQDIKETNSKINELERLSGTAQATLGKQAEEIESKGLVRTILNN